jgi:hypothetical protein
MTPVAIADRVYRYWLARHRAFLAEKRIRAVEAPGAEIAGIRGPERSVGRGRSAPGKRGAN